MKNLKFIVSGSWACWIIICGLTVVSLLAQDRALEGPFTRVFDTGAPLSTQLTQELLQQRTGWTQLSEDKNDHQFKGDTLFLNDKLVVILRRGAAGAELYSRGKAGLKRQAVLTPAAKETTVRLSSVQIVENNSSQVVVDAAQKTTAGKTIVLRYELQMGQSFVKTESRQAVNQLQLEAPCRFVVLPDFFADDIIMDARKLPVAQADLPSENFIMHLLGSGETVLMGIWDKRTEDVRIRLTNSSPQRTVKSSQIPYGPGGKIWIAILADKGIWHERTIKKSDAGREIPLAWQQPFPAQWRVDWRRIEGYIDSWEMLTELPNGQYVKHNWFGQPEAYGATDWMKPNRQRWTTVLGRFYYPCWVDRNGRGRLQPLTKKVQFEGPALIYPINRVKETPIDKLTIVDLVRNTLGVGPCEYILDVEGQQKKSVGIATCAARNKLNAIYKNKQQKQKRAEVEKALDDGLAFVQHIRTRIEDYVVFGRKTLNYLAREKKAHPELAEPITEMETIVRRIDEYNNRRKDAINTPAYAVQLVEDFRNHLVDYEGADAWEKCQKFGKAITKIGGNQDELVGKCRMVVKLLRQRAGIIVVTDSRMAEIAREIRRRTQAMLRNPTSYEAPRH